MGGGSGVDAAFAALAAGDVCGAIAALETAIATDPEANALHLLGGLYFFDDDFTGARRNWEAAFRHWEAVGDVRGAALVTADLADLHASALGNRSVANGWQTRGRRLLEPVGRCVERGYVDLALIACEVEIGELEDAADNAAGLADEFGDHELRVLALADGGYARVVQGAMADGFARLDEAMTALAAGEVQNPAVIGKAYCALMSACDRSGDVRRGLEWISVVQETLVAPLGGRPRASRSHCDLAYGSLLCTAGAIADGEASILRVLGPGGSRYLTHRSEAAARLASLRLLQGRVEEALELLRGFERRPNCCEALARAHLAAGEVDVAAAVARRGLDQVGRDRLRAAALLGLLTEVELARDDTDAGELHVEALENLAAAATECPHLAADAKLARARLEAARANHDAAIAALEAASAALPPDDRPLLRGAIDLELAEVLRGRGQRGEAIDHARLAVTVFDTLGAASLVERTDALLRSLGARGRSTSRPPATAIAALTERERQVLDLLRAGLTNAEIATRLFISGKTAEHHVGRVLAKLGVRSRAEAAAVASAAALTPDRQ